MTYSPSTSRRRSHGDNTKRARWLDAVHSSGVSRGAVAWAVALAHRSNAAAKPVWGYQTGQAKMIRCSDRQVRRYRQELEQAGLIETVRGEVERRSDGTFRRTMTNLYKFLVAPLARRKKPSSNRPDVSVRPNLGSKDPYVTNHKIQILDPFMDPNDFDPDDPWAISSAEPLAPAHWLASRA